MSDKDFSVDKRPDSVRNKIRIETLERRENLNAGEVRNIKQDFHGLKEILRDHIKSHKFYRDDGGELVSDETIKINAVLDKQLEKLECLGDEN